MALCPHCQHALPESPADNCPHCGGVISATPSSPGVSGGPRVGVPPPLPPSSPPRLPAGGQGAAGGSRGQAGAGGSGVPWDHRDRLGFAQALVETAKQVLTEPKRFFRSLRHGDDLGGPLVYAIIVSLAGLVLAAFYQALFHSIAGGSAFVPFARRPELERLFGLMQGWVGAALLVPVGLVFTVVMLFVWAGVYHVLLLMLGGARRSFATTFAVVSYGQTPILLSVLPFCGQYIGVVWSLVLYVIGLAEAHGVDVGKSALVVLIPVLLLCCCCAAAVFLFMGTLASVLGTVQ